MPPANVLAVMMRKVGKSHKLDSTMRLFAFHATDSPCLCVGDKVA